ncbi:MAG: nicotinate-nucleotide--dimethylbenzimidazole phosphoribosyltransferase [Pseudomonadota bacterium]
MSLNNSPSASTSNAVLERALRDKLKRRAETTGSLGELEALAVRIGLIQNSLKPTLKHPQLMVFAADHGLAADGLPQGLVPSTSECVHRLLSAKLALSVFAQIQGMQWWVADAGMAEPLAPHARLMLRKIGHGTRNARLTSAMQVEQAHAAIRAGMEIGDALHGNVVACAAVGVGANESAALVLSHLTGIDVRGLLAPALDPMEQPLQVRLGTHMGQALERHRALSEPVDVLAALGGFDIAMMVGLMLVVASKRSVIVVDGLPAVAALMVASRITPSVADYCIFSRSNSHPGLDRALALFNSAAMLELGMESVDGTGTTLVWPMLNSAAALLTEVAEGEEPGPTLPGPL